MKLPDVLIVEDDRNMAGALVQVLSNCYQIDIAETGEAALALVKQKEYELVLLDLNLPDLAGIAVCQHLRNRGVAAPILILSGEASVMSKINLLDAGADDYLTKPFSLGELKARLRALQRHNSATTLRAHTGKLVVGDVTLDRQSFTVQRDGQSVELRRKEFALLECLMEHAGTVVTRDKLKRYVWHTVDGLWTNTVDVHINHLRAKIDRPFGQALIRTVHGLGYKIDAPPSVTEKAQTV